VIPIVDDKGKLVGVVTDRDVCMAAFTQGRALQELPIHIAMSRHIYSARPEQSTTEVLQLMRAKQVRRIPVVNADGHPVGIVSLNDLTRDAGTSPKITEALGAICKPHADTKRAA
jgi:CBS domain-containing protein